MRSGQEHQDSAPNVQREDPLQGGPKGGAPLGEDSKQREERQCGPKGGVPLVGAVQEREDTGQGGPKEGNPLGAVGKRKKGVGILPTFLAHAENPKTKKTILTRVLCDTGAQVSLGSKTLADELQLQQRQAKPITIGTLGGGRLEQVATTAVLSLGSAHTSTKITIQVLLLPKLVGKCQSVKFHPAVEFPSIKKTNVPLADVWPQPSGAEVDVVLGQDYLWEAFQGRTFWPTEGVGMRGPMFIVSPFGLIMQGCTKETGEDSGPVAGAPGPLTSLRVPKSIDVDECEKEPQLETLLKKLWSLESLGISVPEESPLTAAQAYAVKYLEDNLEFLPSEKKYQVKLPFNPKSPPLQNNYHAARHQLEGLLTKLNREPVKRVQYEEEMEKYLTAEHAAGLSEEDKRAEEVFYVPHRGVFTHKKGTGVTKCRIVFNASARDRQGQSLNSSLLVGPVPNSNLLRILCQWRQHTHAVNTDIKACFLSIKLHPEQQNFFRFLWVTPTNHIITYKFTSLIFGSAASPWVSSTVLWKVLEKFEEEEPDLVERIRRSIWVDDILLSVESIKEGQEVVRRMQAIFQTASFHLAKFVATDKEILKDVEDDKRLFPEEEEARPSVEALGVEWTNDDHIRVGKDLTEVFEADKGKETKRSVARAVASVYDPLQLLLPWKVGGNIILRDIWMYHQTVAEERRISKTAKKLWEEVLPPELQERIANWKKDYQLAGQVRIPRCLKRKGAGVIRQELYGFSDASPLAYGAVIYVKTIYTKGPPTSIFVTARGKVNPPPPKGQTLPRCELLGAKFLARLVTSVKEYLGMTDVKTFLFSDSTITLTWLKQEASRWRQFVSNQVTVIQRLTRQEDWYHIPGEINPADLLTRPHDLKELLGRKDWLEGPDFILSGKLPEQPNLFTVEDEEVLELKPEVSDVFVNSSVMVLAAPVAEVTQDHPVKKLFEKCSNILEVLRMIALMKRPFKKVKPKGPVFADRKEMAEAMDQVARLIQQESFRDTINLLNQNKPLSKADRLVDLNPFMDENGLLRAMGRFDRNHMSQNLPYDYLFPLILPSESEILAQVILFVHEGLNHAGVDILHAHFRQKWWILKSRATIKRYKSRCVTCRRFDGSRMDPKIAPLPRERLDVNNPPFTHMAMDGLGPVYVKTEDGEKIKKWLLVMCCYVVRAINIEILDDLSADSFVSALRLQFAEFGLPKTIRLDNLRAHVKAAHQIESLMATQIFDSVQQKFRSSGIKFSYSAVGQPSTNGIIERCVRTVKDVLKKTLKNRLLNRQELHLFIKEARRTINSRPLAQVRHGELEDQMAISPNHLLYGHQLTSLPFLSDGNVDRRRKPLVKIWDERQKTQKVFHNLYLDQYVSQLRTLKKWKHTTEPTRVGDLCIVADPSSKRKDWPIAVVDALRPNSQDQVPRTVRLRMADSYVSRSVRSLVFLRHLPDYEASGEVEEDSFGEEDLENPPTDDVGKFCKGRTDVKVALCLLPWQAPPGKISSAEKAQEGASP